jgi:hypothetical protein
MKLGLTTLLALALAALLLVPAAGAKPGNGNGNGKGNGNGQGPPAWAGAGKPDQAEKDARKAAKRAAKAERRAARAQAPDTAGDDEPKHQNPAWICKFEREQMGAEAFAEEYGANDNKANAFGKCVSREAQDRDGVDTGDEETPEPADDEPTEPEAPADEGDPTMAAQAFFAYLWPFLRA